MNSAEMKLLCVPSDMTIRLVMERMNSTAPITENKGFLLVIDGDGRCEGVVSDGDIRNTLAHEPNLEAPILHAINRDFVFVTEDEDSNVILRKFEDSKPNIPVLDADKRPIDLLCYSRYSILGSAGRKIIRARVPARVSFSGGGTDASADFKDRQTAVLTATINKFCTTTLLRRDDDEIHILSRDLNLSYAALDLKSLVFGDELDLVKAAIVAMQPHGGFDIEIQSDIETGTGLGGSSSVVASVLGCLNALNGDNALGLYELADLAYKVERMDMNLSGGWQDQYSTIFGGFNWVEFSSQDIVVSPLRLRRDTVLELENNLMLFRVGDARQSATIQDEARSSAMVSVDQSEPYLEAMLGHSLSMRRALLKGHVKKFGDLLDLSWQLKKKQHHRISSPLVDECYDLARSIGALGGKLLGAGEGGFLLLYASPRYQQEITEALVKLGVVRHQLNFNNSGMEVWRVAR